MYGIAMHIVGAEMIDVSNSKTRTKSGKRSSFFALLSTNYKSDGRNAIISKTLFSYIACRVNLSGNSLRSNLRGSRNEDTFIPILIFKSTAADEWLQGRISTSKGNDIRFLTNVVEPSNGSRPTCKATLKLEDIASSELFSSSFDTHINPADALIEIILLIELATSFFCSVILTETPMCLTD